MNKMTNKKLAEVIRKFGRLGGNVSLNGHSAEELPGIWHWLCATGPSRFYPKRDLGTAIDHSLDF